jgi:hypothetical protein
MLHALVLAAQALPIGNRTKNTRAEQAVALGLKRTVIDGFGLCDFTMRPTPDLFRRCQADADRIEIGNRVRHVKGARTIQGDPPLPAGLTRPLTALELQFSIPGRQFLKTGSELWPRLRHREQMPQRLVFQKISL